MSESVNSSLKNNWFQVHTSNKVMVICIFHTFLLSYRPRQFTFATSTTNAI